jgi:hypothetical protein
MIQYQELEIMRRRVLSTLHNQAAITSIVNISFTLIYINYEMEENQEKNDLMILQCRKMFV